MQQSWQSPELLQLAGRFVTLKPLDPSRDVEALYAGSHGTPEQEAVWNDLPDGGFDRPSAMQDWMVQEMVGKSDPFIGTHREYDDVDATNI